MFLRLCLPVNSICWAPHEFGLMLACGSSDGAVSIVSTSGDGSWETQKINNAHTVSWRLTASRLSQSYCTERKYYMCLSPSLGPMTSFITLFPSLPAKFSGFRNVFLRTGTWRAVPKAHSGSNGARACRGKGLYLSHRDSSDRFVTVLFTPFGWRFLSIFLRPSLPVIERVFASAAKYEVVVYE